MFPNVRIVSMYGQTECKRVCYLPADELDDHPDSVGIAIPNSEVYIIDQDGERLGPGETGELVVRGSHVARGYWRAPELTAQRFRPGPTPGEIVPHTGDLFRADEQGRLYFVSRKDDIIKSRGEKVSPREVENAVRQLPGVAEASSSACRILF
jgi:long-chain acyl-CoA synthetase